MAEVIADVDVEVATVDFEKAPGVSDIGEVGEVVVFEITHQCHWDARVECGFLRCNPSRMPCLCELLSNA